MSIESWISARADILQKQKQILDELTENSEWWPFFAQSFKSEQNGMTQELCAETIRHVKSAWRRFEKERESILELTKRLQQAVHKEKKFCTWCELTVILIDVKRALKALAEERLALMKGSVRLIARLRGVKGGRGFPWYAGYTPWKVVWLEPKNKSEGYIPLENIRDKWPGSRTDERSPWYKKEPSPKES